MKLRCYIYSKNECWSINEDWNGYEGSWSKSGLLNRNAMYWYYYPWSRCWNWERYRSNLWSWTWYKSKRMFGQWNG